LVLRINICGENRHLRQARKRYQQFMKNAIISTICILTAISCNSEKSTEKEKLIEEISFLETENLKLKDSLKKVEADFLYSQILIGIPNTKVIKVGKKNEIVMLLQTFNKTLPKYEIYKLEGNKEIKVGESNQTRFEFQFTPKTIEEDTLELLLKMPYNGRVIKIPGKMNFDVEK
jgi:hypothetical protein